MPTPTEVFVSKPRSKWALIQSGEVITHCDTIRQCMKVIKRLNPESEIAGSYVTEQLFSVEVKSQPSSSFYTILWRMEVA